MIIMAQRQLGTNGPKMPFVIAPLRRGFSLLAPRRIVLSLFLLCRCTLFGGTHGADDAFSGSSAPAASHRPRSIVGGVLIGPGAGGIAAAEELARGNCERYHLNAEVGGAVTVDGSVRLTYTCQ
jgi:hypothetical protein